MRKKIFIAGASGLLGVPLSRHLKNKKYEIISHSCKSKGDVSGDFSQYNQVQKILNEYSPDVIINLVALTNVDQCENDPQQAYLLNVHPVENITRWIKESASLTKLIHVSTDMLYDSIETSTEDEVHISNMYSMTKYAAELVANTVESVVLRTNFFGPSQVSGRSSFSDWLLDALKSQNHFNLFTDVHFSPLSLDSLMENIEIVIEKFIPGVYNLGSKEGCSKADFADTFADYLELNRSCAKYISISQVTFKAVRPTGMKMDSSAFEKTYQVNLPNLDDEIKRVADYEIQQRNNY